VRIGISNVAWNRDEDEELLALLPSLGVEALEVAPTKLWDDPLAAPLEEYRRRATLPVVSLQSLLFGHPELRLFDASRSQTMERLQRMCDVAARLGASVLVFGSPQNRRLEGREPEDAIPFFQELGRYAESRGVCVCIEPLPPQLGTDFLNTVEEAVAFVAAVGSAGLDVHLDSATLHLTGEQVSFAPRHFHATELGFGVLGSEGVDHARYANELRGLDYGGVVSIEMFALEGSNRERVLASVEYAQRTYG
jgi:sugar phosphate isomerase/epimerase